MNYPVTGICNSVRFNMVGLLRHDSRATSRQQTRTKLHNGYGRSGVKLPLAAIDANEVQHHVQYRRGL